MRSSHRTESEDELESVRAIRPILYELLAADRDRAAELVNELLSESGATPQLVRHGDWDWHLHAVSNDADVATRIVIDTAMAMIDIVRDDEMSRLGICADDGCVGIVLDLSRNRSRRFCSTACGNRNAVAAYRARQAAR
jgi:predicted RNA-binding Zn ribbon-like protein